MKALIFAAGNGTRLRPLTDKIPKPMVYVGGKPVLEHIVTHLNKFGIKQIIVNLHYKPRSIYEYFGNRLLYFYEPVLLGETETERRLAEMGWLDDKYFCFNGDTLTDINLVEMERKSEELHSSVKSFDQVYTGAKFVNLQYRAAEEAKHNFNCYWRDIGTFTGLEKARAEWLK